LYILPTHASPSPQPRPTGDQQGWAPSKDGSRALAKGNSLAQETGSLPPLEPLEDLVKRQCMVA
jgi:hypothetical protein